MIAIACCRRQSTGFTSWVATSRSCWRHSTGFSDVQVRAIARSVEDKIEEESGGRLPLRKEGLKEGRWILLDYGEVIVHALTPDERSYYDLESFWGHGEKEVYLGSEQDSPA